jgi:hypothetical protein
MKCPMATFSVAVPRHATSSGRKSALVGDSAEGMKGGSG